jgi:hypothetical protein
MAYLFMAYLAGQKIYFEEILYNRNEYLIIPQNASRSENKIRGMIQ